MHIKELISEKNIFLDENDIEHQIPEGCLGMTEKELQHHIDVSAKFIKHFMEENGYGKADII